MDPKGDRLRKIQMGQLKLPESVLKINNIQLTEVNAQGGGGCLEGGSRPRPLKFTEEPNKIIPKPTVTSYDKKTPKAVSPEVIPLPSNADIPLPSAGDIPLPKPESIPLPCGDVPKPCPEDIPLPSNDSIPLPADKPIVQPSERRKIRVLLPLEPRGDELLCRSCAMRFVKQQDYDTHLQSEEHEQALKEADLFGGKSPGNSFNQRSDKKSPSHDAKSAHVSFGFIKNLGGSRITYTQPFARREERNSPIEIKLLKPETENGIQADEEATENDKNNANVESSENFSECKQTETEGYKDNGGKGIDSKLMCSFVKVHSKDESGRVINWLEEMIQYTVTEPKIMFSCNPFVYDLSKLFDAKPKNDVCSIIACDNNLELVNETVKTTNEDNNAEKIEIEGHEKKDTDEEKTKSHKKKKKKHKKHKDKSENKEVEQDKSKEKVESKGDEVDKCAQKAGYLDKKLPVEEGSISSKKKKKKHKRRLEQENKENKKTDERDGDNKESFEADDKEKKKHKKSKKKSKHPEEIAVKVDGEEEKKPKKRKKKKSKKIKKKLAIDSEANKSDGDIKKAKNELESIRESDGEKENDGKKKLTQEKHNNKGDVNTDKNESCENEVKMVDIKVENRHNVNVQQVPKSKFSGAEPDSESEKIMAKLQTLSQTTKTVQKSVATDTATQNMVYKDILKTAEKKTPTDKKRFSCEANVNDSIVPVKKLKVASEVTDVINNVAIGTPAMIGSVKLEKEDSWSKIETQTNDNVKSKWDTSDSDMENPLDKTVNKEKMLKRIPPFKGSMNKAPILKALKSPSGQSSHKVENDSKKKVNPSLSNRSNKSNLSTGSNQLKTVSNDTKVTKSKKVTKTSASSHSRSRSHNHNYHRSYSRTGSSSRSRSYSSSSYSDDSRRSRRHRRNRRSSSRSYSRSTSRSHSRSHRGHSLSYSEYSRSRSYSSHRSRSRSNRRHKRSYSRRRSRSYSSTSYSSRSRSRNRYKKKIKRKGHRKSRSKLRSQSPSPIDKVAVAKKTSLEDKRKVKEEKVDPSEIPLPNLSNEKDDERTEEKLQKLKEKKRKTDVGETVAKLVESRPSDIPLPFSDTSAQTVSSDSLPIDPPAEALKETDTGFIGPKMPAPPPPPPQFNNPRFGHNHGPLGPPMPGYGPGIWDHWDSHGHWDGPGPWDGPSPWDVPGHRPPPFRGMRPPYDPRLYGPYDPRRRGQPPPYMNHPRGPPFLGSRYPVPSGPRPDYPMEYDSLYTEDEKLKRESPPPLPKEPPRKPSPKPPPPKIKELKEPEQNPDIVIPPEQVELYKNLQKQAAKHARRQLRRQAKKDVGEPDSTSSESEPEEQPEEVQEVQLEEMPIYEDTPQIITLSQPMILAQPQPASSPTGGYVVVVSGGQQYLLQKSQAGVAIQTGQPMIFSQGSLMASTAVAHPTHIMQAMPQMVAAPTHMTAVPMTLSSLQQLHQIQQIQQIQQFQHIQQIQNAHAIQARNQARNQAVAMAAAQHGPIIVGNRLLVPTIGVRPAM